MAASRTSSRLNGKTAVELIEAEVELEGKVAQILGDFGPDLLRTPIADLRRMADTPCVGDNRANIFGQIWDKYRFLPTVSFLRKVRSDISPDLPALIHVMEQVWDESGAEDRAAVRVVA